MNVAQIAQRLLVDAGLDDAEGKQAHEAALEALLGGEGTNVQLAAQVATLAAVLLGVARQGERGLVLCAEDAEHMDCSSLEVLDLLATALAQERGRDDDGAGRSKLFALVAVRTTEGVTDKTMARWVEEEAFATHLCVGQLTAEAARELACVTAWTLPPPAIWWGTQ